MPNYTFTKSILDQKALSKEVMALLPGKRFSATRTGVGADNLVFAFMDTLSAGEITILTDAVTDHSGLGALRNARYREVDARTSALIANGFLFNGMVFSLSNNAQNRLMGVNQVRDEPELVYPISWNTKDDGGVLYIATPEIFRGFYLTAMGTYRAHVDSGTILKDNVRDAVDAAAIAAVVDSR